MKYRWIVILFVLATSIVGCAPAPIQEPLDQPAQEPQQMSTQAPIFTQSGNPFPTPAKDGTTDYGSAPLQKFIDLAKEDLATSLAIGTDQISVLDTLEITWPDSALGCPEPGKFYAQGQVPGYRIWLNVGDMEYDYHTDLNGQVLLCPNPEPDQGSTNGEPTPQIGVPIK